MRFGRLLRRRYRFSGMSGYDEVQGWEVDYFGSVLRRERVCIKVVLSHGVTSYYVNPVKNQVKVSLRLFRDECSH